MDGLYERDALAWAEQQAALLRRLADGERVNAEIDWDHVIEEVHDVGLSELHSAKSLIELALRHLLLLRLMPNSLAERHWQIETEEFLDKARERFSPSMRQRIDLARLYGRARRRAVAKAGARVESCLPIACPLTLDDMLSADVPTLLARLSAD